jgi:PPOX class probable F420-dependent enzyme
VKLTETQASFLHDEPNVGIVAVLREDGSAHQTVVWVDYEDEHVLLNLNNFRAKLDHLRNDPRVSLLVIDRADSHRWLGLEGHVVEITTEGAYEHIVRQSVVYFGRNSYPLGEGEERVLVRIALDRVEDYKVG